MSNYSGYGYTGEGSSSHAEHSTSQRMSLSTIMNPPRVPLPPDALLNPDDDSTYSPAPPDAAGNTEQAGSTESTPSKSKRHRKSTRAAGSTKHASSSKSTPSKSSGSRNSVPARSTVKPPCAHRVRMSKYWGRDRFSQLSCTSSRYCKKTVDLVWLPEYDQDVQWVRREPPPGEEVGPHTHLLLHQTLNSDFTLDVGRAFAFVDWRDNHPRGCEIGDPERGSLTADWRDTYEARWG